MDDTERVILAIAITAILIFALSFIKNIIGDGDKEIEINGVKVTPQQLNLAKVMPSGSAFVCDMASRKCVIIWNMDQVTEVGYKIPNLLDQK